MSDRSYAERYVIRHNLRDAVRSGNIEKTRELIDSYGLSYSSEYWSDGYNLLVDALNFNRLKMAKLLLTSGSRVNRQFIDISNTPLHIAIERGYIDIVDMLLEKGAKIEIKNELGQTPLYWAIYKKNFELAELFLNRGADINVSDIKGFSLLHHAVWKKDLEIVEYLLNHGADINVSDYDGFSLLHYAVMNKYVQIVEYLLKHGACINSVVTNGCQTGSTPLHMSVEKGNEKLSTLLINNGANTEAINCKGQTPLFCAIDKKLIELTELFLNRGADVNVSDNDGFSLLFLAVRNEWLQIVEHLLKHGAYINPEVTNVSKKGYTPLHMSVENGNEKLSTLLINNGADINFKGEDNITPLHIASMKGYAHIVQDLLNHGACTDLLTLKKGYTPLMIAINSRKETVVQLLLQHITNIDSQDKDGCTILNLAVKSDSLMIVKDVLKHCPDINNQSNKSSLKTAVLDVYSEESRNLVDALLEYGLTFNLDDANDPNLLIDAVQYGLVKIVDMLILIFNADVNSRDKYGTALLDIAIKNKHVILADLLLRYGSDIHNPWGRGDNRTSLDLAISYKNDKIIKALKYHIIKMKIANLHVSDKNLGLISGREFDDFRNECKKELDLIKREKIDTNISVYDILTKNIHSLEMYTRNENIVQVFKLGDYETKFPVYASMINNNFRKTMERKKFVEQGPTILHILFKNYPLLPYICAEKILSFLDNKDIKTLLNLKDVTNNRIIYKW